MPDLFINTTEKSKQTDTRTKFKAKHYYAENFYARDMKGQVKKSELSFTFCSGGVGGDNGRRFCEAFTDDTRRDADKRLLLLTVIESKQHPADLTVPRPCAIISPVDLIYIYNSFGLIRCHTSLDLSVRLHKLLCNHVLGTEVDVAHLLDSSLEMFQQRIRQRNVTLVLY